MWRSVTCDESTVDILSTHLCSIEDTCEFCGIEEVRSNDGDQTTTSGPTNHRIHRCIGCLHGDRESIGELLVEHHPFIQIIAYTHIHYPFGMDRGVTGDHSGVDVCGQHYCLIEHTAELCVIEKLSCCNSDETTTSVPTHIRVECSISHINRELIGELLGHQHPFIAIIGDTQ